MRGKQDEGRRLRHRRPRRDRGGRGNKRSVSEHGEDMREVQRIWKSNKKCSREGEEVWRGI